MKVLHRDRGNSPGSQFSAERLTGALLRDMMVDFISNDEVKVPGVYCFHVIMSLSLNLGSDDFSVIFFYLIYKGRGTPTWQSVIGQHWAIIEHMPAQF